MKLVRETSPYIRKNVSVARMMIDVLIALLPVVVFAIIQNGWASISVILISILTMLFGEMICTLLIKWPEGMKVKELFSKEGFKKIISLYTINNLTAPLISAIIYAMILPAGTNWYVVLVGATVGIVVGKMLFGGLGSNIFNPAAVGRVFVGVCFGSKLIYNNGGVDVIAGGTPLSFISDSLANIDRALSNYSLLDLFLGFVPGSMGEVSALMIIIGGIYLFIRRSADLRACLSMLLSFAVITFVVSLVTANVALVNPFELFAYEMLSGGLFFGAVYMITDPVTSPTSKFGRIVYGVMVGSLTALIRYIGAFPEGVAFSILIANMFVPVIDHFLKGNNNSYNWKQAVGVLATLSILILILSFAVSSRLGAPEIKETKYELFEEYNKSQSDIEKEGFDSDYIIEKIVVNDKEGNFLGHIFRTKYWVFNETTNSYDSIMLMIGIDENHTLNGVYFLEMTHINKEEIEQSTNLLYIEGITEDKIKEISPTNMTSSNFELIIKDMVLDAFSESVGGAE